MNIFNIPHLNLKNLTEIKEYIDKYNLDKMEVLKQFYLWTMVEDPIEGTEFDHKVLDTLEKLID